MIPEVKKHTIKFRGKTIAYFDEFGYPTDSWVYGYYRLFNDGSACIMTDGTSMEEVVPESVGQFIGMLDKFGREIYEGDVIENNFGKGVVVFSDEFAQWLLEDVDEGFDIPFCKENRRKIVGNVFDNKEMEEA